MTFEDLGIKTQPGRQRYTTICPECNEKRTKHKGARCLTVNDEPDNQWWKCHHCGWSGNLGVQDRYEKVQQNSRIPSQQREFTLKVRDYLKKRGISLKTAKKLRLYETNSRKQTIIAFPYFMNLTLVNVKFLNMDWKLGDKGPKWYQLRKDLGTKILPFGMQNIKTHNSLGEKIRNNTCIITEGEWDMLTFVEAGYDNVLSVPQGAPSLKAKNFEKEFAYLQDKYVLSVFKDIDLFYLAVDNDPAGRKLQGHLAMILGKEKCRIIRYPTGYKDANDVLKGVKDLPALGIDGVKKCVLDASSVPLKGVIKASMVYDEMEIFRNDGFVPGLGCGIKEVDYLFTVKPKHIMFVTGVPGSGKSVWVRWWLVTMIQHNADLGLRWAMFTPENRPVAREYAKIVEALTGMSIRKGFKNSMNEEMYRKAMRFVEKHFFVISPDKRNFESFGGDIEASKVNTIASIQHYLQYLKKTENIFGYVIDAWNKIEHEQPKWQAETTFISEQLDRLIDFNDYWDLHGIVIVHPRKIEMKDMNYKMPSLYDVKGSSAWKEKADIGVLIHRYKMKRKLNEDLRGDEDEDEKYEVIADAPTIIRTEKIRFEETGHEARVRMKMSTYGQFYVKGKDPDAPPPDNRISPKSKLFDDDDEEDETLPF